MAEPLAQLKNLDGTLSYEACLELFSAVYCSYVGSRQGLQNLLNITGGGEILYWLFDPAIVNVDFSISRQGNRYILAFAGTASKIQMYGNILGGVAATYYGSAVFANSFFNLLWIGSRTQILAALPSPGSEVIITITGHSMGGAVGQLAGNELAGIYGSDKVELLAFAQPKALTKGYTGPSPATYLRVQRFGDPVPYMPPKVLFGVWVPLFLGGGSILGSTMQWQHYGEGWILREDATLAPDPGEQEGGWLDAWRVNSLSIDAHLPKQTAQLLRSRATEV